MLRELLVVHAGQLKSSLEAIRIRLGDSGDKGSAAEASVRELLAEYLPRTQGVGNGEIIDRFGGRSQQLDLVVAGPEHPATYQPGGEPGLFLVEAVTAVGQIKSVVTSAELTSAVENCSSVKSLTPDQGMIHSTWEATYNNQLA